MSGADEYFGKYRIVNVVNVGQTSILLQGYDAETRTFVGIKTLQNRFLRNREQVAFLKWEHEVGKAFASDNVIKILQFAWDGKKPYLVLEWYPELNLKILISKGYDSYAYFLPKIIPAMAKALAYLHEKGWAHRDVKPDNFLYGESGGLKLIDFALAKKCTSGIAGLFSFSRSKAQGTASYIAPEQILTRKVDPRSDVYSLGCTYFELLSGKLPYTGNSVQELLQKQISSQIPSILAKNKNITPEASDLLNVMMAKKPQNRPKNCGEVVKLLDSTRIFKKTPMAQE